MGYNTKHTRIGIPRHDSVNYANQLRLEWEHENGGNVNELKWATYTKQRIVHFTYNVCFNVHSCLFRFSILICG